MVINKRKKNSRQRATTTHGWGSMKKHRGKGNKGGSGNAGTGKRGDAKKPSIWQEKKYFGKYGFKSKSRTKIKAINLDTIEEKLNTLLKNNKITKENDTFIIDLSGMNVNKLLGSGRVINKLKINVDSATERAIKKVTSNGGEVITNKKK